MDQCRLNRTVFVLDKSANGFNWSKSVKKICKDHDLLTYWNENKPVPLDLAKTKVKEQFRADWEHHCATKPKLRTYVTFKNDINVATHINCNMPKYDRSLVSQLRLGILPLRIETGRFSNLDETERICLICNSSLVRRQGNFCPCMSYMQSGQNVLSYLPKYIRLDKKFVSRLTTSPRLSRIRDLRGSGPVDKI